MQNEYLFLLLNEILAHACLLFSKVTFSREKVVFTILKMTFRNEKVVFSALKTTLLHINIRINIRLFQFSLQRLRYCSPCGSRSAYSEGATPKCLRKMVEKWARFEKPTV